ATATTEAASRIASSNRIELHARRSRGTRKKFRRCKRGDCPRGHRTFFETTLPRDARYDTPATWKCRAMPPEKSPLRSFRTSCEKIGSGVSFCLDEVGRHERERALNHHECGACPP